MPRNPMQVVTGFLGAVYNAIAGAVTSLPGGHPPPALGWHWTVKDALGNGVGEINDLFAAYMKDRGIRAGQFALRRDGALVMSTAYTWAEPGYRITETDSLMRIASVSKAFTTAAILDLVGLRTMTGDEPLFEFLGIVRPDARVSSSPDPLDPRVRDITVGQVFHHAGGWNYEDPNVTTDPVFALKAIGRRMQLHHPPTKMDFAQYMFDVPLDFDPGSDTKYSNVGYLLLGLVVERASGRSYIDYVNDRILQPLGIHDVFVGRTRLADRRPAEVVYEDPNLGPDATIDPFSLAPAPFPYGGSGAMTEVMDSGGGLITTASSISRFINAHNVWVDDIRGNAGRGNATREGNMPGTSAVADSFSSKDGSTTYDIGVIFNQFDNGSSKIAGLTVNNDRLGRFILSLENTVRAKF